MIRDLWYLAAQKNWNKYLNG